MTFSEQLYINCEKLAQCIARSTDMGSQFRMQHSAAGARALHAAQQRPDSRSHSKLQCVIAPTSQSLVSQNNDFLPSNPQPYLASFASLY
jgi:hypothetical protein